MALVGVSLGDLFRSVIDYVNITIRRCLVIHIAACPSSTDFWVSRSFRMRSRTKAESLQVINFLAKNL